MSQKLLQKVNINTFSTDNPPSKKTRPINMPVALESFITKEVIDKFLMTVILVYRNLVSQAVLASMIQNRKKVYLVKAVCQVLEIITASIQMKIKISKMKIRTILMTTRNRNKT
jgi:hypothetical protein